MKKLALFLIALLSTTNGLKGHDVIGTVTRPDGSTFPLKAGRGKHQNSGDNAMAGTCKVTTKVCGQEKTCTITYP